MQGFENGSFSSSLQSFLAISNGEVNSDYVDYLTDELAEFDIEENFDISNHSGVYNWNSTFQSWDYSEDTTNTITLNFPFASNQTVNNTTVTIDAFTLQEFTSNFETIYMPTKIQGSIQKDGNEIFNIDLDNVNYREEGEDVSVSNFDLEVRTVPMTHLFTLHQNALNQFEFDYSSHNDNACNTTISLDATTTINDFVWVEDIEDFATVSGKIGHDALEIRFNAQVDNLSSLADPTAAQINQLVDAKVYLNNNEVGSLEYSDVNDEEKIFIVFSDGTREDATNYVNQDLADQLEAVFSNYID